MKAIYLALFGMLFFGIVNPIAKVAFNKGMHADGLTFTYAVGLMTFAMMTMLQKGWTTVFPSSQVLLLGVTAGILCSLGFRFTCLSLATPTALVSVVMVIVAMYPLISTGLSLTFLNEAKAVVVPKLLTGSVMVILGGVMVSTSIK